MSMIVRWLGEVAAFSLAAPAWAQQACTQSDIEDVWELYIGIGEDDDDNDDDDGDDDDLDDILDDDSTGWSACRVTVASQGEVSGACVTDRRSRFRIVDGQLAVRDNCSITGRFVLQIDDQSVTLAVPRAVLSRSGDLIAAAHVAVWMTMTASRPCFR